MTCDQLSDQIETYVTGDLSPSADAAAHLRTCPRCQQAWALASQIQQVLGDDGAMTAPPGFTDCVLRQTHRVPWWKTPEFAASTYSAVSSGVLVAAGVAIWMSLGDGPLDASALPVAVAGLALAMGGLALDLRLRLSDLLPY
jgi:hypothetical protein